MHISKLKQRSYASLKQTRQRRMLNLKLRTWIWNGFWSFKVQRTIRKLLVEAKFKSSYLYQTKGMCFKPKNMVNTHEQWMSSKFIVNFELISWISNWAFFFSHLWVLNWFETHLNFEINHWRSILNSKTCQNKFQMPPSNLKCIIVI